MQSQRADNIPAPLAYVSVDSVLKEEPLDIIDDSCSFASNGREHISDSHINVSEPELGVKGEQTRIIDMDVLLAVVDKLEVVTEKLSAAADIDHFDQFGKYLVTLLRKIPQAKLHWIKLKLLGEVNLALDSGGDTSYQQYTTKNPKSNQISLNQSHTMQSLAENVSVPQHSTTRPVKGNNVSNLVVNQARIPVLNSDQKPDINGIVSNQAIKPLKLAAKVTKNSANHVIKPVKTVESSAMKSTASQGVDESRILFSTQLDQEPLPTSSYDEVEDDSNIIEEFNRTPVGNNSDSTHAGKDLIKPKPWETNVASSAVDSSSELLNDPLSSPSKVEKVVKAVKKGMPYRRAAEQCGVAIDTIYRKVKQVKTAKGGTSRHLKRNYPDEALTQAVEAVRGGMKLSAACKWYGIPCSTLHGRTARVARQRRMNDSKKTRLNMLNKVKEGMSIAAVAKQLNVSEKTVRNHLNQSSKPKIIGRPGILSKQEETQLVEWLDVMIKADMPVTRKQIKNSAQAFLNNIGKSDKIVNLRQWVGNFMMRNQQSLLIEEERRPETTGDTLLGKGINEWVIEVKECVERAPLHLTDVRANGSASIGDSTFIS